MGFQEVILFLSGKAYGFAAGGFSERFSVDRHDFWEVAEISEVFSQIHPRVGRGLLDGFVFDGILHHGFNGIDRACGHMVETGISPVALSVLRPEGSLC